MGGTNDGPWACCTINSTIKNAAEVVQTGNLPIADETIPYAFIIVITPDGQGGGYITAVSTENLAGLNITLQRIETNLTTIKLANNALNIDLEPIENSDNLITSGGVYEALASVKNLPIIQETEGTTVLDTCTTEGIYSYISPTGVQHKLIVSVYFADDVDGQGNSGTLIYQTIIATPDFFGDIEERGIYQRYGTYYMGEYSWGEFEKSLTENDIKMPESTVSMQVYVSKGDHTNRGYWHTMGIVPPVQSFSNTQFEKIKLVAKRSADGNFYNSQLNWEADVPEVYEDPSLFPNLDTCTTEGEYIYVKRNGERLRLIVSSYITTINDLSSTTHAVTQMLIKINDPSTGSIPGVYVRSGYNPGDGFKWDTDFSRLVTENDINEIIPSVTDNDNGSVLTVQDGSAVWKEPSSTAVSFTITLNMWISYGSGSDIPRKYICPIRVTNLPYNISNENTIIVSSDDDEYSLYDIYCEDPISDYSGWGDSLKFIATSPDGTAPSNNITVKVVKL